MNESTAQIETDRDFANLIDQLANGIRRTDWGPSTDDISRWLYGMIDYVDNSIDPTSARDGLKWNEIGAMILEGLNKTKACQSLQSDADNQPNPSLANKPCRES